MRRDEILKEAPEYIKRFHNKVFVVKYGGSMLDNEDISDSILDDIIYIHRNNINIVLVHGGGSAIDKLMKERGREPRFAGGLRVTDEETAGIVDEALSRVNVSLVERIRSKGVAAESLVSRERLVIKGRRINSSDCGDCVGDVDSVDIAHIHEAINKNSVPVVSPVGIDEDKRPCNINADMAAAEIAAELSAEKLLILTNVKGVMRKRGDEKTLISTLKEEEAYNLIEKSVIDSGMIPKVRAGIRALDKGVRKVHVISGGIERSLLVEVFTAKGIGTEIVK